ncbi:MAG TPA: hypothetical protein VNW53_18325 [Phenylobacterium sp.]|jgi:hypothetical protein|uniref:hypothetical protein n=1 Tax=Phenylobacterium sp. TaxID=1871053 RepID=UPI002BD2B150|nr:hypothetical protein [Phenylobacterium sp.]HXA40963.1 hypothetical protein [Phenylobacterium sp.]
MRRAGWFRLWLLLTVLGVPAAAIWGEVRDDRVWQRLDEATMNRCVDVELSRPDHPDAVVCARRAGAYKANFQREGTTLLRYWSLRLGVMFVGDLIITGLVVAFVLAIRWVVRGFRATGG